GITDRAPRQSRREPLRPAGRRQALSARHRSAVPAV
ncbi:MAG: hypothetical protein AVDCRST_MAG53-968, partial [uncultured Solirubrobacteraceae bacterium]